MDVFEMKFAKLFRLLIAKAGGIKIEEIEVPRMRDVRILDKLVDDLAKGKDINRLGKMIQTMRDTCLFDTPAWGKIRQRIS